MIGNWGWAGRLGFLSLGLGFAIGGLGGCGGPVAASEPTNEPTLPQPDADALEPVPVEVLIGAIERKPQGEPEHELEPKPTPMPPAGLSTVSCEAFDPKQLVAGATDQDCDEKTPETCPQGTHIDWVPGSPCASCVEDSPENRSCAWATACFEPFVESIAHASGAKSCKRDSDCARLGVVADCGPRLSMALRTSIDEELPMIASLYSEQNCSLCPDAPKSRPASVKTPVRCVDQVCR